MAGETHFTVERVRYDEENGVVLISGADDEEEPAGYFIVQIEADEPDGPFVEFLGEELGQFDGVASLEIGERHLAFAFEPTSEIGKAMASVRITSRTGIGDLARQALSKAFAGRVRLV